MEIFYFLAGVTLLVIGAELLVKGSSRLAEFFGVSKLVIGLTIVAFGTSAPEAFVSLDSALRGNTQISIGNVIGSNIFNILCILGISALVNPIKISQQVIKKDTLLMLIFSGLMVVCALDGRFSKIDGLIFIFIILNYTFWSVKSSIKQSKAEQVQSPKLPKSKLLLSFVYVVIGLALLVYGSKLTVIGASEIARFFGVSELVIGLTIVAAGTSFPELATSLIAAIKKENDLAIGNVIGSNIFNVLGINGLSALLVPTGLALNIQLLKIDLAIMMLATVLCLPFFLTKYKLSRLEGGFFLCMYIAYLVYVLSISTKVIS